MKVTQMLFGATAAGTTRFAIELLPPLKGAGPDATFAAIDPLADLGLAYVNVTYHREEAQYTEREGGLLERRVVRRRPGTVGISAAITQRYGIPAVPHMICGGQSRYDLEDALIDLDLLGINNVLALRGDNLRGENAFKPHPGGHTYATQLVQQIAAMNRGEYVDGATGHKSDFCIGAAGYPEKHAEAPNMATDIAHLKEKVAAGAQYIVTQMSFDNRKIFTFINACRAAGITVPVIPGIKPLSTREQLTLLPQIFHVDLPEELVDEALQCKDNKAVREVGIRWAVAQARELKAAGLPLIHFYTMGKTDNMVAIAKEVF
ncbi:MAG: methylenetetrahydrofolate reductase [Rikenellaceae bacterium]|jgi:methylenetetrahydrofolate reductase (NADPH)|nr:methylenetetrahydrofolate reductase [Rikenellaceae bacterium]